MSLDTMSAVLQLATPLLASSYPGRGLVVGLDETGKHVVQIYWIMGRSENSRNRIFSHEGGRVFTEAADPSKVSDPSLLIYNAMNERREPVLRSLLQEQGVEWRTLCQYIVSNGDQTDTAMSFLSAQQQFHEALMTRTFEPDEPNFTPRITALCSMEMPSQKESQVRAEIVILRRSFWADDCERHFFTYELGKPDTGYCITTYNGLKNHPTDPTLPLVPYRGEPFIVPLFGNIADIAIGYWDTLDKENRVALVTKFINIDTGVSEIYIINKYKKA